MARPVNRFGGLLLCGLIAACDAATEPASEPAAQIEPTATASSTAAPVATVDTCTPKREAAMKEPAVPGNEAFEKQRAAFIARVRGATLLWKREPKEEDESAKAVRKLESAKRPLRAVRDAIHKHRKHPERLRGLFLREGYFYVRGVDTAVAAVQQLGLTNLFDSPTLRLLRDGEVIELKREKKQYAYPDGERAELLYGDRIGDDGAHLAVDFSAVQGEHNFERLRVEHFSNEHLVAQLRYDGAWVPALFDVSGPAAKLICQGPSASYAVSQRRGQVQTRIREAIEAQVRERLPFDAPKGKGDPSDKYPLRARWKDAVSKSLTSFEFKGRRYPVYDEEGRPRLPQHCLDFVYDTWERASGTWWSKEGKRIEGGLEVAALSIDNQRRVSSFMKYAVAHPEVFDVWTMPEDDRVVFKKPEGFVASLEKHVDQFRLGDMLIVRRPRHTKRARHHVLIALEIDPISGVPALLAGNSAIPRIQTFDGAMTMSPNRYLMWRVRPAESWLDAAILKP